VAQNKPHLKASVDWLTTIAIASIAISLTVGFHEGMHALSCIVVGGDLQELSALHALCDASEVWQGKIVSGIASVANIIVGFVCLAYLRRAHQQSSEWQFFLWLFMLMNWLNGAGYWMFSGIANIGDWANVIAGWEPHILWRIVMTAVGTGTFAFFVWFALKELGQIIGGSADEQIGRATKLGLLAYATAGLVILLAGVFNPYGIGSLPVIAGLLAVLGGLSPLAWMMQWFRAKSFVKLPQKPLEIQRQWSWIGTAGLVIFIYAFVLGRTLYF
jgi:hypothetical protein